MHTVQTLVKFVERAACNHADQLIHPRFSQLKQAGDPPHFGLCYAMSEALFYLIKQQAPHIGVKPIQKKIQFRGESISHWALLLDCGTVIDIAKPQFPEDMEIPYHEFKGRGFYPQQSNACQFILEKVDDWLFLLPKA